MFRVGAGFYSVRITDEPIVSQGERCVGLCVEESHTILISDKLQVDRRLHTLLHELAHAHIYATGRPRDIESLCDFVATVAESAMRDLASIGGEEALRRLRSGETLQRATAKIGLLMTRSCRCGGKIAPGEVLCTPDPNKPGQVTLGVYCEHCDETSIWNELATYGGAPSGVLVGEARIEKGRTIKVPQLPMSA
jgi:hypothetical protein